MNIETKSYESRGVRYHEQIVPDSMIVVDAYHPCSSNTPWDYHGMRHQREIGMVLQAAGIEYIRLRTTAILLHPTGTGSGGCVRLGDCDTPGVYKIAVPNEHYGVAMEAISHHKERIEDWINGKCELPEACRG